jgi:DNA polymerase III gamma/tau subunit
MSFIYKYAPTLDSFELANKEVLMYHTHILLLGDNRTGKSTLTQLMIRENEDVLFINNLKDQGIYYIRNDVKSFCQMASSKNKKLIIDGLDELLEQSQQILLSYLDKFGRHVKFVATATNEHKIVESFYSRFITVKLVPPSTQYMYSLLSSVLDREHMVMEPEAKTYLHRVCGSNVRSMLNYLEKYKIMALHPITVQHVKSTHSDIEHHLIDALMHSIVNRSQKEACDVIVKLYHDGYSIMDIIDAFYEYVKLNDTIPPMLRFKLIKIICKYITILNNIHEHHIELLFFIDDCINIANAPHS